MGELTMNMAVVPPNLVAGLCTRMDGVLAGRAEVRLRQAPQLDLGVAGLLLVQGYVRKAAVSCAQIHLGRLDFVHTLEEMAEHCALADRLPLSIPDDVVAGTYTTLLLAPRRPMSLAQWLEQARLEGFYPAREIALYAAMLRCPQLAANGRRMVCYLRGGGILTCVRSPSVEYYVHEFPHGSAREFTVDPSDAVIMSPMHHICRVWPD